MLKAITRFRGKNHFLSNFSRYPVTLERKKYPTVEHAFQAMKSLNPKVQEKIRKQETPLDAKRLGNSIKLRDGWDKMRTGVMFDLVYLKFTQNEEARKLLIGTGKDYIIEGNRHHDDYWGVCLCSECQLKPVGQNRLGLILMEVRRLVAID